MTIGKRYATAEQQLKAIQESEEGLLERLVELEAQLSQYQWIPVSERLPEEQTLVFIFEEEDGESSGYIQDGVWLTFLLGTYHECAPKYWMSIPPLPESE